MPRFAGRDVAQGASERAAAISSTAPDAPQATDQFGLHRHTRPIPELTLIELVVDQHDALRRKQHGRAQRDLLRT